MLVVPVLSLIASLNAVRSDIEDIAVVFIVASYFLVDYLGVSTGVWAAVLIGSIGGIIVGLVTEYYTCLLYTSDAATTLVV